MMDRNWLLKMTVALAGAAALWTAGCSKNEPTATNSPSRGTPASNQSPATTAVEAEPESPTVVFRYPRLFADNKPLQAVLDQFHSAYPKITIKAEPLEPDANAIHKNYLEALAAKPAKADVVLIDVTWLAELAQAGHLRDLTDECSEPELSEFFPGALEAAAYLDRLYALPFSISAGVLFYRTDLLEAQQLGVPRTWGDVARAGTLIQQKDPEVRGLVWPTAPSEDMVLAVLEFLYNNGGNVMNRSKVVINSPDNLYALSFAANLISRYKITPPPSAQANARTEFINGKAALIRDWSDAIGELEKAHSNHLGVAAIPSFPSKRSVSVLKGWQLCVAAGSRQPKASLLFAKYLGSAPSQKALALAYPMTPAVASIYTHFEITKARPELGRLLPILRQARPGLVTPDYGKVISILQENFGKVLSGQAPADNILQMLQQDLQIKGPKLADLPPPIALPISARERTGRRL